MQVNSYCSNLRQLDLPASNRISLELGEQQRFELPKLLEAWEAKFPSLHKPERLIQSRQ